MKTLQMTDDISATRAHIIKVRCDCGWYEKMYAETQSVHKIDAHMRDKHNEGLVIYRGKRFLINNKVSLKDAIEFDN